MVCVSFEGSNLDGVEVQLSLLEMRLKSEVTLIHSCPRSGAGCLKDKRQMEQRGVRPGRGSGCHRRELGVNVRGNRLIRQWKAGKPAELGVSRGLQLPRPHVQPGVLRCTHILLR